MQPYHDLDAFKVCHELTLALYRLVDGLRRRDPELAGQLWQAALVPSSRIARASVFENTRMSISCLNRSLGALSEIGYFLSLGDGLGLIDREIGQQLEGLRARAKFYVTKLIFSLLEPPQKEWSYVVAIIGVRVSASSPGSAGFFAPREAGPCF